MNPTRRLSWILLLATAACGKAEAPARSLPQPLTAADAERVAAGLIPILILQEGAPRPHALVRVHAVRDSYYEMFQGVAGRGDRAWPLDATDPAVVRADERGIAWWQPQLEEWAWRFQVSAGVVASSDATVFSVLPEGQAAARMGLLLPLRSHLPAPHSWPIRVLTPDAIPAEEVPLFLALEDGEVVMRLRRGSGGRYDGDLYREEMGYRIFAGFSPLRAQVAPRRKQASPITFDLRESGSIEVRLLGSDGELVTEPRAVFLAEAGRIRMGKTAWSSAGFPYGLAHSGRAVLHGVPIGAQWQIGAALLEDEIMVAETVAGPQRPGERVSVTLSVERATTHFQGRLLDASGAPARRVAARVSMGGGGLIRLATDDEGRFDVRLPRFLLEDPDDEDAWTLRERVTDRVPRMLELPLTSLREGSGARDWTWSEDPDGCLAMGKVVDEFGVGIPRAEVMSIESGSESNCNANGAFVLPAESDVEELVLEAFSPWHWGQVTVAPGQERSVTIVAPLCARVGGSVRVSPKAWMDWHYTLGDGRERYGIGHGWLWPNGTFEIGPIPAEATQIRLDFGAEGTVTLKNLRLVPGESLRLAETLQPRK